MPEFTENQYKIKVSANPVGYFDVIIAHEGLPNHTRKFTVRATSQGLEISSNDEICVMPVNSRQVNVDAL